MLHGGYPEVLARPSAASLWFSSCIQTYLERDVRAITMVRDLSTFRRFLALLATRHGQVLNNSRAGQGRFAATTRRRPPELQPTCDTRL
jgi:uncharacterized protein